MSPTVYNIVYIICNLFHTYIIFKLMRLLFDKKVINIKIEIYSYVLYFILTTLLHLFIHIPVIMLTINIILFFMLSFNYQVKMKNRIFYTMFSYLLLMFIEQIIVLITGYVYDSMFKESTYSSIWGLICIKIVSFAVVFLLEKYESKKHGMNIPMLYWLCICAIPLISLYIIYLLFRMQNLNNLQLIVSISILFLENFIVFYLYDIITNKLEDKAENLLLEQQNRLYLKQLQLMQMSLQATKEIRHDLKNHLSTMRTLAKEEDADCIIDYINKIDDSFSLQGNISNSNNITIDSIINFKSKEASQNNIKLNTDINIPSKLNIEPFDMTIILGNLIDNAIQAVVKLTKERIINIKIKYDKGRLLIKIVNDYKGKILLKDNTIETTKTDKENHGIGFKNIEKVLEKYMGEMDIQTKENKFTVSIIIYIP